MEKDMSCVAQKVTQKKIANFRQLEAVEKVQGADIAISLASVKEVHERLANTLYEYFLGNPLDLPVVDSFVKNAWTRFGISRVTMNSNGFFFFKFTSKEGMERVLEHGQWFIKGVPLILNIWSPGVSLTKEKITSLPVWVKLHDVPLAAFTEDGLSMIGTKIGKPRMLDADTSYMLLEPWGRNSYARALIDIRADEVLKEDIIVAIACIDGSGYTKETVHVEYEWKPPRCSMCKIFGHSNVHCPDMAIHIVAQQQHEANLSAVASLPLIDDDDDDSDYW